MQQELQNALAAQAKLYGWRLVDAAQAAWASYRDAECRVTFSHTQKLRQGVVLARVTRVVEEAGASMRMSAVHAAVEQRLGEVVPRATVNEALSTHSRGRHPQFRRLPHGVYEVLREVR